MLARLRAGELTVDEALEEIRRTQLVELAGQARIDLGRTARRGIPEVVLASGKAPAAAARLIVTLAREQGQGLGSRLSEAHWTAVEQAAGDYEVVRYGPGAALVRRPGFEPDASGGRAGVITAGTSDLPVAEEARMVLEAAGVETRLVSDVGVAGLHRLLEPLTLLRDVRGALQFVQRERQTGDDEPQDDETHSCKPVGTSVKNLWHRNVS